MIYLETIFLDIEVKNKDDLLNVLSENLLKLGKITSVTEFLKDVYIRESQGETGIEKGLAIPHGKSTSVVESSLSMARLSKSIEWETLDEEPVNLVILFAVKNDTNVNTNHLDLLSRVAGKLVDEDILNILKTSNDKGYIINTLLS